MDSKTSNIITMVAGIIFIVLGAGNISHATSWWHYATFIIGIIVVCFGVYGYKTGRKF
jgi:hypothetical protein